MRKNYFNWRSPIRKNVWLLWQKHSVVVWNVHDLITMLLNSLNRFFFNQSSHSYWNSSSLGSIRNSKSRSRISHSSREFSRYQTAIICNWSISWTRLSHSFDIEGKQIEIRYERESRTCVLQVKQAEQYQKRCEQIHEEKSRIYQDYEQQRITLACSLMRSINKSRSYFQEKSRAEKELQVCRWYRTGHQWKIVFFF